MVKESKHSVFARLSSLITLFLLCLSFAEADDTYPYSYSVFDYELGGKLISFTTDGKYYSFFVKPTFGEFAESVFFWEGIKRGNVTGIPSIPPSVISSREFQKSLLLLSTEETRLIISRLDMNLQISAFAEVPNEEGFFSFDRVNWLDQNAQNEVLLLINDMLYLIKILPSEIECQLVAKNVMTACFLTGNNYKIAYVKFEEGNGLIQLVDSIGSDKFLCRIDISDEVSIRQFGRELVAISSSKFYNSSLFQVAHFDKGIVNKFWIESKADRISIVERAGKEFFYYLRSLETGYVFVIAEYEDFNKKIGEKFVEIPKELSEPYGVYLLGEQIFCIFHNGIAVLDFGGNIIAHDFITLGEFFPENLHLYRVGKYLVFNSKTASLVLEEFEHSFWLLSRFIKNFGKIIIPLVLVLILIFLGRLYYKQKRLLKALIEVPTTGVVFIVDKFGRLLASNNSGKDMLGITESVPLRRIFSYYCTMEHLKNLNELVEKVIASRDTFVQKINFVRNKTEYEWLFTVLPLKNIAGSFKGAVITGTDITEVLGRQRLTNLAQLAHDMQTNLSTIRLNAEQIEIDKVPKNEERKRKIIHQVGLLMQRVRDIVTVGRGEIVKQEVDAYELCMEARMEFDEVMFPNVEFELDLQHFPISCDKPKMIRAVRNAIENAIKAFQGRGGKIKVSNWKDSRFGYFSVNDNGPGMDKGMIDKILKPYFTTGGSGIGTMIMQHVVELHGGRLEVRTEKGKGTEIIFVIPLLTAQKRNKRLLSTDNLTRN